MKLFRKAHACALTGKLLYVLKIKRLSVQGSFKAFSLVEMLMALLVASILLVALAPVITKRVEDNVSVKGDVPVDKSKVVYLTDKGTHDWDVPAGINEFDVTVVGAGGGGGAGMSYGCTVFTDSSVAQNSILSDDTSYCNHVRGDGDMSFTIPEGAEEIYVSLIGGGGGGASGKGDWAPQLSWNKQGSYTWSTPQIVRGDRVLVSMNGAGGGGGGSDQGGGGGGASGGFVNWTNYNITESKTSIPVIVGGGGKGGYYRYRPGEGGYNGGSAGTGGTGGGGGGGASSFDGVITAFGGGGGASGPKEYACGWFELGGTIYTGVVNTGGVGRQGGNSGPYNGVGGLYGGTGANGGGVSVGGNGANGYSGSTTDDIITGSSRGGSGGIMSSSTGTGGGGFGQDKCSGYGGGAGGGGGASAFGNGASANTGCIASAPINTGQVAAQKAGVGAGGAGGSCGWNAGGNMTAGDGGDGIVLVKYVNMVNGGTAGQAGPVIPRSRVALTTSVKAGSTLTVNIGKGGAGGDRMAAYPNGSDTEIRTMNVSSTINSTTNLSNANGKPGSATTLKFGTSVIATTGSGGCGGTYNENLNGPCGGRGTVQMNGQARDPLGSSWHGHQSGTCGGSFTGTSALGGESTLLLFDTVAYCGSKGGTIASRNGIQGAVGRGGSGAHYGGFGGAGGGGYVKIEWGIPRNLDKSTSVKYSGGGGSAGEFTKKRIKISPVTRKIKYTIGEGGNGAEFDINNSKIKDGSDGGNTIFGIGESYKLTAKGGKGGKSAKVTSTYDGYFMITSLTGTQGAGGISDCTKTEPLKCKETMNGSIGEDSKGGKGGNSITGEGAYGGTNSNPDGYDALNFDGYKGGAGGGGGGSASNQNYGKGGKGADGYIKIEWYD